VAKLSSSFCPEILGNSLASRKQEKVRIKLGCPGKK